MTCQLLLNSVWAIAHSDVSDIDSHYTPHYHLDSHDAHQVDGESDKHELDTHCHVHLCAFIMSASPQLTIQLSNEQKQSYQGFFSSLTYSPPVPPPTV